MRARTRSKTLCCSFCGKGPDDVAKIIPGDAGAICDECVRLANELLEEDGVPTRR